MSPDHAITSSDVVSATSEQVACDLSEEVVILNLHDGAYYGLDSVGATVWALLQEPRRVSQIRDELLETYDVEPGRCMDDLLTLLSELIEYRLVQVEATEDRETLTEVDAGAL